MQSSFFSHFRFVLCGSFYTYDVRPSIIRRLIPPYRKHSTAQSTRGSSNASTCRSEGDNAGKQRELARASITSGIYTARRVLHTNQEIENSSAYKSNQPFTTQLSWCDTEMVSACALFFLSVLSISFISAAYGLFLETTELLEFANRYVVCTKKHGPLCDSVMRILLKSSFM